MTTASKPGADQLARWKAAIARHRRGQRQQRGRHRRQPRVLGYRIPPPDRQAEAGDGQDAGP